LQLNVALDTVRNEYLLHTKLHAWLVSDSNRNNVEALNEKVYAELFLTPSPIPGWVCFRPDVYTALEMRRNGRQKELRRNYACL